MFAQRKKPYPKAPTQASPTQAGFRATALAFAVLAAAWCAIETAGCAALGAAQSGIQGGVSGVQSAGSTGEQVKGLGTQAKDLITGKKKGEKGGDDEGSGDDDDRLKAKDALINTPLNDKVDFKKGDKEDWRKFHLLGKPGVAAFELFWDNEAANLELDVYDAYGVNIGRSPPRMEGQSVKRILVQVGKPGMFYVRVRAPGERDKSIYTLNVRWSGTQAVAKNDTESGNTPSGTGNPANPSNPTGSNPSNPTGSNPSGSGNPSNPSGSNPSGSNPSGSNPSGSNPSGSNPSGSNPGNPPSLLNDPNRLLGNIISAYRDGNGWVLYIDRGSTTNVRQGAKGVILEGGEGDKLLERGDFSISRVVDGGRSIATAQLSKGPGKNKRVLINLR